MATSLFSPTRIMEASTGHDLFDIYHMTGKESSFLTEALSFAAEQTKAYADYKSALYKSILESNGNEEIVHESFADFFAGAKKIIDKFLDFIKRTFAKFITNLNGVIKSDKYLIKHKNDFNAFGSKHEFRFEGYTYTLDSAIPLINAVDNFSKEFEAIDFSALLNNAEDSKNQNAIKEIKAEYQAFIDSLQNDWYDNFRAEVIGAQGSIDSASFDKELFACYRNASSEKEVIDVTRAYVDMAYLRFASFDKMENNIKKTKDTIEKEYNQIKKKVEQMASSKYDTNLKNMTLTLSIPDKAGVSDTVVAKELISVIDTFIKAKVDQVANMSTIHAIAFAAKLEAVKDCYKQDKAVLYKALSKIQGTIKESLEVYHVGGDKEDECCEDPLDCPECTAEDPCLNDEGYHEDDVPTPIASDEIEEIPYDGDDIKDVEETIDNAMEDIAAMDVPEIKEAAFTAVNTRSLNKLFAEHSSVAHKVAKGIYGNKVSKIASMDIVMRELAINEANIHTYCEKTNSEDDWALYKGAAMNSGVYVECLKMRKNQINRVKNETAHIREDALGAMAYAQYVYEKYNAATESERFISECMLFGSNRPANKIIAELSSLNEGAGEAIKNGFTKVTDFLKKVWAKFIEKMTSFIANDKTYLNKYKDTILKVQPKDATYNMKRYSDGVTNITSTPVPIFNYGTLKDKLVDDITFQNSLVSGKNPARTKDQEFTDYCKALFTGGDDKIDVKSSELNMTDLFNYCYNYDSMKTNLNKDLATIEKAATDAGRVIDGLTKAAASSTTASSEPDKADAPKSEAAGIFAEKATYSALLQKMVTESEVERKLDENPKDAPSSSGNGTTADKNLNSTNGTEAKSDETKTAAANDELKDAKERINVYLKNCSTIMTAKMTAAEEIYKSYMSIIRFHVNDHIENKTGASKVAQAGTDYSEEGKSTAIDLVGNEDAIKKMGKDAANTMLDSKGKEKGIIPDRLEAAKKFINSLF